MSVLLEVDNLKISARRDDDSLLPIVKGVSFNVARGEVEALIGESGQERPLSRCRLWVIPSRVWNLLEVKFVWKAKMSLPWPRRNNERYEASELLTWPSAQRQRSTRH